MATQTITTTEAARHFSDYLNRVAYRHEAFVLSRGNKPVAELRPLPAGRRLGDLPEILRSLPRLTELEAKSLADDLALSRQTQITESLRDPWAS